MAENRWWMEKQTRRPRAISEASLSTSATFSGATKVFGDFNLSITGTWAGTITVQRSFDSGATWEDVESYTSNVQRKGCEAEPDVRWRSGFKAGEYTSGTVHVRLSQ